MRYYTALAIVVLLTTGCSAPLAKDKEQSGGSSIGSARELADTLACTGYKHVPGAEAEMFTSDSGECDYASDRVTLDWFNSSDALKNYRKIAGQFGGSAVYGDDWAVVCQERSACVKAQGVLGGNLD